MNVIKSKSRTSILIFLAILFFINPFICFCSCLFHIAKNYRLDKDQYKVLFFICSSFLGVLAFTQETNQGDIIRVYESVVNDSYNKHLMSFDFGSSLFRMFNVLLYQITGKVQYLSLIWVTLIYYLTLLSILNIFEYKQIKLSNKLFIYVFATLFCFVIFTQVTEIMKQGVATSMFLYGVSNIINSRKIRGYTAVFMSLMIHGASFFYLPLLLAPFFKSRQLFVAAILSFLFRSFNLMNFVAEVFSGYSIFSSILQKAEIYSESKMANFYRSDSPFFFVLFLTYAIFTLIAYYYRDRKNPILVNICLLMIIVLNLNYSVSHNFTRILTMLFPFYLMLLSEYDTSIIRHKNILIKCLLTTTFIFSFVMIIGRISTTATYHTTFMNNSFIEIMVSPLYRYLTF